MRIFRYLRLCGEASIVALVLVLLIGSALGQPIGIGYVETGSMQPTLAPGDGFIAIPTPLAGSIERGDVVTFHAKELNGGGLTTHRVVSESEGGYITRGDYNSVTDQQTGEPPVPRSEIVAVALQINGQVISIPNFGAVVVGVQGALTTIARIIGIRGTPTQFAVAIFGAIFAGLILDELLSGSKERQSSRQSHRPTGYNTR